MKSVSSKAIVALMTATLGLTAIAPAMAQDAPPPPAPSTATDPAADAPAAPVAPGADQPVPPPASEAHRPGDHRGGPGMHRNMGLGEVLALERGAEAIEIAIVRLSYALDLTAEQQGLLETLKTDALNAAAQFETATEAMRPAAPVEGQAPTAPVEGQTAAAPVEGQAPVLPDLSQRFQDRIAMEKAHLAALEAIEPAFTAFADSLTEDQQAKLMPQPGQGFGPGGRDRGPAHEGRGGPMAPRP